MVIALFRWLRGSGLARVPVQTWCVWAAVVLLAVGSVAAFPHTFSAGAFSVLSALLAILVLTGIGQSLVIGTGGIDLSIAGQMTLTGGIVAGVSASSGLGRALVLCVVAAVLTGLVNGLLVEVAGLNALVVTLSVGLFVSGIYLRIQSANGQQVPGALIRLYDRQVWGLGLPFVVAMVFVVIGAFIVGRTVAGRRLVASGASKSSARLAGVHARGYRTGAYVVASLVYMLAAILLSAQVQIPDITLGSNYLLASIVVVVLGGATLTGGRISCGGTLGGAVFLIVMNNDLQAAGFGTGAQMLAQGAILALSLIPLYVLQRRSGRVRAGTAPEEAAGR